MHEQQPLVNEQIKISFTFLVLIFFANLAAEVQIVKVDLFCLIFYASNTQLHQSRKNDQKFWM